MSASASPAAFVLMHDNCDPATFNATFGPGTCVGKGDTTVGAFLAQLGSTGKAVGWAFYPGTVRVDQGSRIRALDTGGEPHTFTRVANFGGGCVQPLNDILGLTPVPECSQTVTRDGQRMSKFDATLAAPGTYRTAVADTVGTIGTIKFECLIHPWMRTVVRVDAAG